MAGVALQAIVAALGGELVGASTVGATFTVERIAPFGRADRSSITFLTSAKLAPELQASQAGCVIVSPALRELAQQRSGAAIVTPDPYLYYARLTQWWVARGRAAEPAPHTHPSAVIDPSASVDSSASVGACAVIESGASVGPGAVIGAHCHVGRDAKVGAATRLAARVTLGDRCSIGERGIVHSGVVIGADGFGFAPADGRWEKIEQLGAVRIGDDVEIGANTCIDRGALDDTVIGNGVKLDNLIQIAHNVRIGDHSAIAACTGIAGSTVIGKHCTIGGAGMIVGHIELADHVHISGGSLANRSIKKPGRYTGTFPIDENAAWEKNAATLRQLHALRDRIRALERAHATADTNNKNAGDTAT